MIPAEGIYDRYSRELALQLACNAGNQQCLDNTFMQVKLLAEDDRPVPVGLESVIYCSGFRGTGKTTEWLAMWRKMQNTNDATFKSRAIAALGCSDDPMVLKDYLESTLGAGNSVNYTQADRRAVLAAVLNSHSGLGAVIDFMTNFDLDILSSYGYATMEAMLAVPARTIKTEAQQTTFNNFVRSLTGLDAGVAESIATIIETNIQVQRQSPNDKFISAIRKILQSLIEETTPIVVPTTVPTTVAVTTTEESTTLSASTSGIKLVTLVVSLLVAFNLRA